MKKILFPFVSILFLFSSCNQTAVVTTKINVTPQTLTMQVGEIQVLSVEVTPVQSVKWSSSDEEVVKVTEGVVQAVGIGKAEVKATADNQESVCTVYVSSQSGQTMSLNKYLVSLNKGETFQLVCHSTYGLPLTWTSSAPEIATVSADGLVTAVSAGNSIVTVSDGTQELQATVAVAHNWGEYQLVWSDEFDGNTLNTDNWNIEVNGNGGGNNELQYYTDRSDNLRVENGNLLIQARKESYINKEYTSGRINSKNKRSFKYGKVEARISFPKGGGTWPAFWMLGSSRSWPSCGEIDIIEHMGNQPTFASFAVHTSAKNGNNGKNWHAGTYMDNIEENYHVWGIEWVPEEVNGCDQIHFLIDDVEYAVVTEDANNRDDYYYWPFFQDCYIIMNLAIGGNLGGRVDDNIFNNDVIMKVDWVRVYQREEK